MLSALFIRLSNRKLLIASSIVAIRNFASHADEYGAALKQFYFAVHPDLFSQYPLQKETNENSLKLLNYFMSEISAKHDVKPVTVQFFLRKNSNAADSSEHNAAANEHNPWANESSMAANGQFNRVEILLKSKHMPTLVYEILSSCRLPIQKDLKNLVTSQKNRIHAPSKIRWSSSLRDLMDEDIIEPEPRTAIDTLYSWILNNINTARIRTAEVRLIFDENRRISRRMIRRHRLKGFVASDTGYSQLTLNGALKQLEFLFRRRSINTNDLQGKTLKIGNFNGLDNLGRFIVDITDVPTAWIQALVSLADMDGLLHVLDLEEMQISEMLWGLRISRGRQQEPVPIKLYYKQVSKLLQSIRTTFDPDALVSPVLEKIRGRITRASDHLCISEGGNIIIPCMATFDALSSFLRLNHCQITGTRKAHARLLQQELQSVETCIGKLQLSSLTKDRVISSEQMIKSCERLKKENFLGLQDMQLIISNYYAISGDGEIRIPWNWKK